MLRSIYERVEKFGGVCNSVVDIPRSTARDA